MRPFMLLRLALACAPVLAAGCDAPDAPAPVVGSEEVLVMPMAPQTMANTPRMGDLVATMDGQTATWGTYDFSVGAFDGSAWMRIDDGVPRVGVTGYAADDLELDGLNRLSLSAQLPGGPVAGAGAAVEVVLRLGTTYESPRLVSLGPASVTLTQVERTGDESYGRMAGTFAARLCRAEGPDLPPDPEDCRDIAGRFDTRVQFDM